MLDTNEKKTWERLKDPCKTELRSTIETTDSYRDLHRSIPEHDHNNEHKPLWNEVKFIDRDLYYYTRRVKEAIHFRLCPDDINRDSGIEIPEAWMPTIKNDNDNNDDKEFI